jgi:hypothetical protein
MAKKVVEVLEETVVDASTQGFGSRDFHSHKEEEVAAPVVEEVVAPVVEEETTA